MPFFQKIENDIKADNSKDLDIKNNIEKHKALKKLKLSAGEDAVNFAYLTDNEWVCICGTHNKLNKKENMQNCSNCYRNRDFTLENYNSPFP